MTKLNWSRAKNPKPTEDELAWALAGPSRWRPRGPSKAELRARGEKAMQEFEARKARQHAS
jgi:hypothetical protein